MMNMRVLNDELHIQIQRLDCVCGPVAWFSGNALVSITVVTLRRARLVLGWVTVCERVNHLSM